VALPYRNHHEAPVSWLLGVRLTYGPVVATIDEWIDAGRLSRNVLRAAIKAGALTRLGRVEADGRRRDLVDSGELLTMLCREDVYAMQLECPPVWRRTLDASVERPMRKQRGQRATRTRLVTAAIPTGGVE
jgi:hypothetical protein